MLQVAVPTRLDDVAVGEDDAAGLVDDEPRGVAGARHLGVEGARRGGAEDDDGGHDAGERAAPVLRHDRRLDLHRELPAGVLLGGALHGRPRSGAPVRRARLGRALRPALGFWGRGLQSDSEEDFYHHAGDVNLGWPDGDAGRGEREISGSWEWAGGECAAGCGWRADSR